MKKSISLVAILSILFQGTALGAPTMQDLRLPSNFYSGKSPYATIENVKDEPGAPGFLIFNVKSPQGLYAVHGLTNLRKCLREIDVLEKIKEDENAGSGMAAGAVDSLKDTGTGFKNLVVHPVDSVSGIGKGVGKLGSKIGGAFRKKEEGEKGDDFLSSTKRELAKKLGVDVYSRNLLLQEKLDSMAKARMGGRGVVAVATFFMPVGLLASAVMTVSNINNAADELVNDNDRGDLYKMNQTALLALGFSKEKVIRFLNHPYYTPREITYLRFYLEKLKRTKGIGAILDAATVAVTEVPADKILHEAQIVADAAKETSPITQIVLTPEGILAEKRDKVFLATAYDYLDVSPLSAGLEERVLNFKRMLGKQSAEIWNGGAVSSRLGGMFLLKGIRVERMCLFGAATPEAQV